MNHVFRQLGDSDHAASLRVMGEAFGELNPEFPSRVPYEIWGYFSGESLVAQAMDLHWSCHFGGKPVPTAAIGGVTVTPEHRSGGLAQRQMTETLRRSRERGAAVSALFGAAPGLYRRLGYEVVARPKTWSIPLSALSRIRVPEGMSLREPSSSDHAAMARIYEDMVSRGTGMMSRADASPWSQHKRASVAVAADGTIAGYMLWKPTVRESADVPRITIEIQELVALDAAGYRALLSSVGTWGSVSDRATLVADDSHPALLQLPGNAFASTRDPEPYMLRVLNLAQALQARGWNPVSGTVLLGIEDEVFPQNSGTWELVAEGGSLSLSRTEAAPEITLTPQGVALWFAGVARLDRLRMLGYAFDGQVGAGQLSDASKQRATQLLDALAAAPAFQITETF